MASIILSSGARIKCKSLTKSAYDKLINNSVGDTLPDLKKKYDVEVHMLANGQAIVKEQDYFTLYYSLEDLKKVLQNAAPSSQGVEVMRGINIYGAEFPKKTSALIKQLCNDLNMTDEGINESQLRNIDDRISELHDYESFNEEHLIHYVALIGEILIRKHQGKWDMKMAEDMQTWNPYLKINNQQVEWFTYLYEDVFLVDNGKKHILLEVYKTASDIVKNNL